MKNSFIIIFVNITTKMVNDGCCSLGIIDGVNYCHPEYPKKYEEKL